MEMGSFFRENNEDITHIEAATHIAEDPVIEVPKTKKVRHCLMYFIVVSS